MERPLQHDRIAQIRPGEAGSVTLDDVWRAYRERLRAFLKSRVSNPADVDDLLQEISLKTFRGLGDLEDPSKMRSWLFQIANRTLADHYRARARSKAPPPDDLWSTQDDPSARRDLERCVEPFIAALPGESARLLKAIDIDGQSQKCLAEREGLPYSTLKSRVRAARGDLRAMFESCCDFTFGARGSIAGFRSRTGRCEKC